MLTFFRGILFVYAMITKEVSITRQYRRLLSKMRMMSWMHEKVSNDKVVNGWIDGECSYHHLLLNNEPLRHRACVQQDLMCLLVVSAHILMDELEHTCITIWALVMKACAISKGMMRLEWWVKLTCVRT